MESLRMLDQEELFEVAAHMTEGGVLAYFRLRSCRENGQSMVAAYFDETERLVRITANVFDNDFDAGSESATRIIARRLMLKRSIAKRVV